MALNYDMNKYSNAQVQKNFELLLATIKWFIENDRKLVNLDVLSLANEFEKFIASEGFDDKSQKDLEYAFGVALNLQKKKSQLKSGIKLKYLWKSV